MDPLYFHPPHLPLPRIAVFLQETYGIAGQLSVIPAERDLNVHVSRPDGDLLFKVLPIQEGREAAVPLAGVLQHIARTMPALPVPRVCLAADQTSVTTLQFEGQAYCAVLLSWLPGRILASVTMSPTLLHHLGQLLARLGKGMRGYMHPAIPARQLIWNMMTADDLLHSAESLDAPSEISTARAVLEIFRSDIKPRLLRLRSQIIHGDVHPYNALVDGAGKLSGIIDFGDMIHGALVVDPANTIADCLIGAGDPEPVFRHILRGYESVTLLEVEERELIVDLVAVRLVTAAIITRQRQVHGLGDTEELARLAEVTLAALHRVQADRIRLISTVTGSRRSSPSGNDDMLSRRKAAMGGKPLLFYDPPLHFLKGEGVWLTASDGRRYLDCYNNVPHVGHAHPAVADAVARQMRQLSTNTRYLTDESIAYAERLKATFDPSLDTVIFVNSGSEANDVAIRMAKAWTGKSGAICMDFAYHGVTEATDAISPSNYPPGKWIKPHVRLLEAPDGYRGGAKHGSADFLSHYAASADAATASLTASGHGVAIGIIDSAFMSNGILDVPRGYVSSIVDKTRAAGGLFIADEVQSGFGRMGTFMWGHQHHGIVPDFVTIGKPAGNGFPIGVIITRAEILDRFISETGPFFSTFGGNNAACAAGLAVLDVIEREGLQSRALATGRALRQLLQKLVQNHEIIGEVRGVGLATGVELVRNRETREPATTETRRLLNLIRDEGVLLGSDGKFGNVLKLRPPLAFDHEHVTIAAAAIDRALTRLKEHLF